jgi:hypothetical protein|tara:strand:- start:5883 stop:6257 length:375 start_codon:yes stop_codon:yes gene_type:complete
MSLHPRFFGVVSPDGRLTFDHRTRMTTYLDSLIGQRVVVTIEPVETTRTMSQNKYYWSCVVRLLADHCGYEEGAMHAELKRHFGVESTKTMSLEEFGAYVEQVRAWASQEMGVEIPDPAAVSIR